MRCLPVWPVSPGLGNASQFPHGVQWGVGQGKFNLATRVYLLGWDPESRDQMFFINGKPWWVWYNLHPVMSFSGPGGVSCNSVTSGICCLQLKA